MNEGTLVRYELWYGNNYHSIYSPGSDEYVVFDPKLEVELNGACTLTFSVPQSNPVYPELKCHGFEVIMTQGGWTGDRLFAGRIVEMTRGYGGTMDVVCEDFLSFTNDTVFAAMPYEGTLESFIRALFTSHNSQVNWDRQIVLDDVRVSGDVNYEDEIPVNTRELLKRLIDDYNIVYMRSIVVDKWHITVCNASELDTDSRWLSTQLLNNGDNIIDFVSETVSREMYNVVLPIGKGKDADKKEIRVYLPEGTVKDQISIDQYGYIVKVLEFDDVTDVNILRALAQIHLQGHAYPAFALTARAIDKHLLDHTIPRLQEGYSYPLYIYPNYAEFEAKCTGYSIDLANPASNEYRFVQRGRNR